MPSQSCCEMRSTNVLTICYETDRLIGYMLSLQCKCLSHFSIERTMKKISLALQAIIVVAASAKSSTAYEASLLVTDTIFGMEK